MTSGFWFRLRCFRLLKANKSSYRFDSEGNKPLTTGCLYTEHWETHILTFNSSKQTCFPFLLYIPRRYNAVHANSKNNSPSLLGNLSLTRCLWSEIPSRLFYYYGFYNVNVLYKHFGYLFLQCLYHLWDVFMEKDLWLWCVYGREIHHSDGCRERLKANGGGVLKHVFTYKMPVKNII